MSDKIEQAENEQSKTASFDYFFEVIGWLQIMISPLLLGLLLGAIIYFSDPSAGRLSLAFLVTLIGLIVGIVFATRVWKKHGTMHFISRVMATPELDTLDEVKKDEKEVKEK